MILCHHVYHHVLTVSLCSVIMPCHYALSLCSVITFYLWFSSVQSLGISRSQCISLFGLFSSQYITPCVILLLEPSTDKNRRYTFMCTNTLTSHHLYDSTVPQRVATTTRGTCGTGKQPLTAVVVVVFLPLLLYLLLLLSLSCCFCC